MAVVAKSILVVAVSLFCYTTNVLSSHPRVRPPPSELADEIMHPRMMGKSRFPETMPADDEEVDIEIKALGNLYDFLTRFDYDDSALHGRSEIKLPKYPSHASCNISWTIDLACADVSTAIVNQMKKWEGPENCAQGGEKCLYELKSSNSTRIEGTHMTPVKKYVDDISFDMEKSSSGCSIHGFSTSETWYAYLDYGTNYCNLHNLITGSGLDKTSGYSEKTSDAVCTQYSSADCEKY